MSSILQSMKTVYDSVPGYVWTITLLAGAYLYNLYTNQNALLYHPLVPGLASKRTSDNPRPLDNPGSLGMKYETLWIKTSDDVKLHAWFIHGDTSVVNDSVDGKDLPTIVFCHANAGNMGLRMLNFAALSRLPANILAFDYRGYGDSDDVPISEEGLKLDVEAVMRYVKSRNDIIGSKVVLFGRSLGGAVALHAAVTHPEDISGVILENTFTSISDMVDHVFPFLSKLKWLILRIKWDSFSVIHRVKRPILFISGAKDQLVPPTLLQRLYAAATGAAHKSLYVVADGEHNDTFQKGGEQYIARLRAFLDTLKEPVHNKDKLE